MAFTIAFAGAFALQTRQLRENKAEAEQMRQEREHERHETARIVREKQQVEAELRRLRDEFDQVSEQLAEANARVELEARRAAAATDGSLLRALKREHARVLALEAYLRPAPRY